MNNCFQYQYLNSVDKNVALAAYNWATYDSQKNTVDKDVIYTYLDGTPLYVGGKFQLIKNIFGAVQKAQRHTLGSDKDRVSLIPNNITTTSDEELYPKFRALESSKGRLTKKEYDERLTEMVEDIYDVDEDTDFDVIAQELKIKFKTHVPRLVRSKQPINNMNATDIMLADGGEYTLNMSEMPMTQSIYSRALDHIEGLRFNEAYNPKHANTGTNYHIGAYIHTLMFTDAMSTKGKSWIFNEVEAVMRGFDLDRQSGEKIATTSLMMQDQEDPSKETENPEVQSKINQDNISPYRLIEELSTFKEVFGVLAIANTCFKDKLWDFLTQKIIKDIMTKSGVGYGSDVVVHEIIKFVSTKEALKDCPKSKPSGAMLAESRTAKCWMFESIVNALTWLSYPVIDVLPYLIEPHFLHRTDLIRQCNSVDEFVHMISHWDEADNNICTRFTREQVIAERLKLSDNRNYLDHSDIVKLANCKVSDLEEVMESCMTKINRSKLMERRHLVEGDTFKESIENIKASLARGLDIGETIDLTEEVYQLGNLHEPKYRGQLKPTSKKGTHTINCYVHKTRQGLLITDINDRPLPDFAGITLRMLNKFAVAQIMAIEKPLTSERATQLRGELVKNEALIKGLDREVAKLTGKQFSHMTQDVINPTSSANVNAYVLNSWVSKLEREYALWLRGQKERNPRKLNKLNINLANNIHVVHHECISSYRNDFTGIEGPTGHCKNWYMSNQAKEKTLEQFSGLYELTDRGGKYSTGEAPTYCYVNKQGYYAVCQEGLFAIIPAWYGMLTKIAQTCSQYDTSPEWFSPSIIRVINNIQTFLINAKARYGEGTLEFFECLEAKQEETGIFVLTQEMANEVLLELHEDSELKIIKPKERVSVTAKEKLAYEKQPYADGYEMLARIAGVEVIEAYALMYG